MSTRIADLRPCIISLDDARAHFDQLARKVIHLRALDAACEKRIAEAKAKHNASADPLRAEIDAMAVKLSSFISSNKELFQSPRKVKTSLGAFGLQKVSELVVTDREALVEILQENGYTDCFRTETKLVTSAIRARVEDGEELLGCHVRSGDTAVYNVTKTLLDESEVEQTEQ